MVKANDKLPKIAMGFSAIGSEQRLKVLQVLVRAGEGGLNVSQIRERSGITAASTLFHHLQFLTAAGLVIQNKCGREVHNIANYKFVRELSDFLIAECCADDNDCNAESIKEEECCV